MKLGNGCNVDGVRREVGEYFVRRHFKMQCQQNGANVIGTKWTFVLRILKFFSPFLACVAPDGSEIHIGDSQDLADGTKRSCLIEGNSIHYREHSSFEIDSASSTKFGPSGTTSEIDSISSPNSEQTATGCASKGKKAGEQWIENKMFRFVCKTNGSTEILGRLD